MHGDNLFPWLQIRWRKECEKWCSSSFTPPPSSPSTTVPVELCLSFSVFFFLHFQGLKIRPRVASLLLRRMGGVWTPVTKQPVLSTLCWSTSSTTVTEKRRREGSRGLHEDGTGEGSSGWGFVDEQDQEQGEQEWGRVWRLGGKVGGKETSQMCKRRQKGDREKRGKEKKGTN